MADENDAYDSYYDPYDPDDDGLYQGDFTWGGWSYNASTGQWTRIEDAYQMIADPKRYLGPLDPPDDPPDDPPVEPFEPLVVSWAAGSATEEVIVPPPPREFADWLI